MPSILLVVVIELIKIIIVLNLIITGLPSIQEFATDNYTRIPSSFKPC